MCIHYFTIKIYKEKKAFKKVKHNKNLSTSDPWLTGIRLAELLINQDSKNLTVLGAIYYVEATWKLVKSTTVKKLWKEILSNKENIISTDDDDSICLERKFQKI